MTGDRRVIYVIGSSAPPVLHLDELVSLLIGQGWDPYVTLSPTAATWVDVDALTRLSGHPVRVEPRRPVDQSPLPPADAVVAAPLTFNSMNKWAAGISDTLALGLLNEALGIDVPVTAAPCINQALQQHPAYTESVKRLASAGVTMLGPNRTVRRTTEGSVVMEWAELCAVI